MGRKISESPWLDLWRRQKTAPAEEKWKWSWKTWRPVAEKLMEGPIDDTPCPVCGQHSLRYHFILVDELETEQKLRYVADQWIGCDACQVQHRSRGLFPEWIAPESVEWAGPLRKRYGDSAADSPQE